MDKEVVKELIQDELNIKNLKYQLSEILFNHARIAQIQNDYARLKKLLRRDGNASAKAAHSITSFLKQKLLPD